MFGLDDVAAGVLGIGSKLIDKLIPDPQAKAAAQLELLKLQQQGEFKEIDANLQLALAQSQINLADAQSGSNYRGGWRPFIGWVCGAGLAYHFLLRPLATGIVGIWLDGFAFPGIDIGSLMTLIAGLLGLGTMRSIEKLKGVA